MLARFHKVNEASRRKKKQIPEEIWEQHEPYIDEECRKGTSVKYIARLIERQSIPDFAPSCRQLRHRISQKLNRLENRRKTDQDLTRQVIQSTNAISNDQDLSLSSVINLRTNSMSLQTDSALRMGLHFNQEKWLPIEMGFLERTLETPTQHEASQYPSTSNLSHLTLCSTNNTGETSYSNQYSWSPNCSDMLRLPSLQITNTSTRQAASPSLDVSSTLSNSDVNRPRVMSEEENVQNMWDIVLHMIENDLLTRASINAKFLQSLKATPPKVAEHTLLKHLNDPRYLETVRKTFWFALKLKNCGMILAFFRLQLLCTPNMINAAYELGIRCQDLDLIEYLLVESVVDLSTYDPFADTIIQDYFSDIDVEDTSDPLEKWHLTRQRNAFNVSSLEFASMQQNLPLVQLLLHNKANPRTRPPNHSLFEASYDSCLINPLYCAISGKVPIFEYDDGPGIVIESGIRKKTIHVLIEAGADVDSRGMLCNGLDHESELSYSNESEHRYSNQSTRLMFAPIYAAASRGEVEIVEYLLKNRAQVKKGSSGELSLLGLLRNSNQIDKSDSSRIARMLIESEIDIYLTMPYYQLEDDNPVLGTCEVKAIDLAYQFVQPEIIRLLNGSGAVGGERTLCYAIRGRNSNLIHTLLRSALTLDNFISAINESLTQKMADIVMHVLSTARAKYGSELGKSLVVENSKANSIMEPIQKAIELGYYDITHQLIAIAETRPSVSGTVGHFQATCKAAKKDWISLASKLFKIAKYPKNIWHMNYEDWLDLYDEDGLEFDYPTDESLLDPCKWHCSTIKFLLDAYIYPMSSETITIAVMVSARDGDEELVQRLFDLAGEDLLIDVPATEQQLQRLWRGEDDSWKDNDSENGYGSGACPSLSDVMSAGHFRIARLLLEHGFTVDDEAFNIALRRHKYNHFGEFLSAYNGYRREIEIDDDSIPILCAEEGKLLLENKLISAHNAIFIKPVPIAAWAISNGSLNLLLKILEGFSKNDIVSSDCLLNAAVELHRHDMLKDILCFFKERGNTPDEHFGQGALIRAVEDADMTSTSLLLGFGLCPSTTVRDRDRSLGFEMDNSSSLSLAIHKHTPTRQEMVPVMLSFLYDTGDIVEVKNGMHNTALLTAVAADNLCSVWLFIQLGYSLNEEPTRKTLRTPLQAACSSSSPAMINFLLDNGANINAPAFVFKGGTALQFAIIRGDYEIVKNLLQRGADFEGSRSKSRRKVCCGSGR